MNFEKDILILLFLLPMGLYQTNSENFGPYTREWLKYEICKGPKRGDCGTVRIESAHNMSDVIYDIDMPRDCPVTKAKVTIGSLKEDGKSINRLWNYRLDEPCEHFVLGPILVRSFNLTKACKINKGHYKVHLNMAESSLKFLGTSFFYGNYTFKIVAFNTKNNFFCQFTAMEIKNP